jgi:hypothetical protein
MLPIGNASTKEREARAFILDAISSAPGDDAGWINLGTLNSYLTKVKPDFDPRLYGHKKLSGLIRTMHEIIDIEERVTEGSAAKAIYVRRRS